MDSDDEYISLNSSEDYGDDGSAYGVDAVLAEKQIPGHETLWLTSWDGYDSDYHTWLPRENFDDPQTLIEVCPTIKLSWRRVTNSSCVIVGDHEEEDR